MNLYMQLAIKEAKKSLKTDDVPVGAIIVENNKVIGKGHNQKEKKHLATNHAEIIAIQQACKKKKNWHLDNCEIYVTLEPCEMCLGAIKESRIRKVNFLLKRTKNNNLKNPDFNEMKNDFNYEKLLSNFFQEKRK